MKCLITFILISVSITSGQSIYEYMEIQKRLIRGDTLIFQQSQIRTSLSIIMFVLFNLPANGQVIISTGKGSVPITADTQAPNIPLGLTAETISDDSLRFFWTHSPDADRLKYYVKLDGALEDSTANDTIIFGGFPANSFHYVHVAAEDNNNNFSIILLFSSE